jgi:hypothetical protein
MVPLRCIHFHRPVDKRGIWKLILAVLLIVHALASVLREGRLPHGNQAHWGQNSTQHDAPLALILVCHRYVINNQEFPSAFLTGHSTRQQSVPDCSSWMRRFLSTIGAAMKFLFGMSYDHAEALDVDRLSVAVLAFSVTGLLTNHALRHSRLLTHYR